MESHRHGHRMTGPTRHSQAGITALGLLILAALVGVVGLAVVKVTPMYIKNMRMTTSLGRRRRRDERPERDAAEHPQRARRAASSSKTSVSSADELKIAPSKNGYSLSVQYEERASYVADIYLLIAYDKQVEITR